ncbi:MAG TPA: FG-GAP-like repeat-containing protein, partial [Pyrinomonadaceae bacterium]
MAVFSFSAAYGAGELDSGFSASAFGGIFNGTVNVVKVLPDGKILIGGYFTEANGFAATGIARLNADGSTDTSFNAPDFFNESGFGREIWAIAPQSDGKILVGGNFLGADSVFKRGLLRLNADGSLDTSFNVFALPASSIVFDIEIQTDNKILVGGLVVGIFRLNADGTFDNTFTQSANGNDSNSGVEDVEIQADGKILIVGRNFMRRLTGTGALDSNFLQSNSFTGGTIGVIKVRPDGKILVGGSFSAVNTTPQRRMCLFNSDGSSDLTFNAQGPDAMVNDIVLKPDGKILISGAFSNYNANPRTRVAQINADGSIDASVQFNMTGQVGVVNDIELQPDGKILVGFQSGITSVNRFNADGTIDSTFAPLISRDGIVNKILQQPDGKILAAGDFTYADGVQRISLARFNANGSLDTSFVQASPAIAQVYSLAIQPDGKILVGGNLKLKRLNTDGTEDTSFVAPAYTIINDIVPLANGQILIGGGNNSGGIVKRLNANGSIDSTFTDPQPSQWVYKVLVQPDGKILVGGQFTGLGNTPHQGIARLNPDGSLDTTFAGSTNGLVLTLALQPDGKVIVGGSFTALNGSGNQVSIGRLNADGTLDTGFVQSTNGAVRAVKILPGGKILIGGTMSAVQGAPHNGIASLNSDGTIDAAFNTFANTTVADISLQSDGKILLSGAFTKINRLSAIRIARLLNSAPNGRKLFDYDGDGKADISVFRPSENRWYVLRSSDGQVQQTIFAISGDIPVPSDYDGDGKTDMAIYRPSSSDWWSLSSVNGNQVYAHWGESGVIARPSDFDGDGKSDYIFFLP